MEYTGINHLALATGDIDTTVNFWRDLLGMRLVAALGKPGYRQYFFEVSATDLIAFFEWPDVKPIEEKDAGRVSSGPFAFDHLAVGVKDDESLWWLKDTLEANGIWVSEVIDNGFIHSIFTFDPNGISLEFCCNVSAIDIRKSPVMADSKPSDIVRLGSEPQPYAFAQPEHVTPNDQRNLYPGEMKKYFK
ncbi:MAG TPA: VOC family protein [Dissulfurispiraceae bacterium]|nr:VOC family protein [Dissulfurispiraceae bacterium]